MSYNRHFIQLLFLILGGTYFAGEANADYPIYTDAERTAIDQLRPQIADYLVPDYMKTDLYHLRLLKAAKFDVENAVEMVKKTSQWRIYNNVEEILNEDLKEYFPDMPIKVEGVDKEGSPILQAYFGKWKLNKYALSNDQGLWNVPVKVLIHTLETAEQTLYEIQKSGRQNISSVYVVVDVDGYSLKRNACPQCLSMTAEFFRTVLQYPLLLKRVIMINAAPKIFYRFTELMNETTPSEFVQIFSIYTQKDNNKWRNEVLKDISIDQLPEDFGGTQSNWYNKD